MTEPGTYDALGEAKRLLRTVRSGALATLSPEGDPVASLVVIATMPDGAPILLLSKLAAHTRHLEQTGRCSLLLAEGGRGDPLAHPRLTVVGDAAPADDRSEAAGARFLSRNPKSKLYAGFRDFAYWIVSMRSAALNGGFARAASFTGEEVSTPVFGCDELLAGEASALEHMNADHRDAIGVYATRLAGLPEGDWRLTGLDPEGMDLAWGDRTGRVSFGIPVDTLSALRRRLVDLAAAGRAQR